MKDVTFKIVGVIPMMQHSARLVDKRDPITIAINEHTAKSAKTKTPIDDIAIEHLEWLGGLYTTEKGTFKELPSGKLSLTGYGKVCIPGQNIEAMLAETAGQVTGVTRDACITAIVSDGNWPLLLDGPSDVVKLYAKFEQYSDRRSVVLNKARIMRTRPIFRNWALEFTISFREEMIDEPKLREIISRAGQYKGLGDYRKRHGMFKLEE